MLMRRYKQHIGIIGQTIVWAFGQGSTPVTTTTRSDDLVGKWSASGDFNDKQKFNNHVNRAQSLYPMGTRIEYTNNYLVNCQGTVEEILETRSVCHKDIQRNAYRFIKVRADSGVIDHITLDSIKRTLPDATTTLSTS